jgi:exodeoxyribonuclease V beta subunit
MTQLFDPMYSAVDRMPELTLINASAGTGKTWTVTHVAARWLVEVEGRSPSQILLVTFGREAASELKSRLREQLEAMKNALRAEVYPPEFSAFVERAKEAGVETLRARIDAALQSLDDLNARTIHSFAALLHADGESIDPAAALRLTRAIRETVYSYAESKPEELDSLIAALEEWSESTSALATLQNALRRTLAVAMPSGGTTAPQTMFRFFDGAPIPPLTIETLPEDQKRECKKLDDAQRDAYLEEANERRNETIQRFRVAFQTMCQAVEEREISIRALDAMVGYDTLIGDLTLRIRRNPEEVRQAIAGQFELVMIDEFQDTDVAQWEIFRSIFHHGDVRTPMVLVGDAKQAIYEFRGGDVTVIQRTAQSVLENSDYATAELNINYRSHEQLINAVNQFYQPTSGGVVRQHVFAAGGSDRRAITYSPVRPSPKKLGPLGRFVVRDLVAGDAVAHGVSPLHLDLVSQMQRLLGDPANLHASERHPSGRAWRFSDIAVLCCVNAEIDTLQRLLEDVGIPCVTPKSRTVFSSSAAKHFRALIWAMCDPGDVRRMRTLVTTWFAPLVEEKFDFGQAAALLRHNGIGVVQRMIFGGSFMANILSARGGLRIYTDIDHCFELLANEFPSGVSPLKALEWFDQMVSDADDPGVELAVGQRRIESDENAVRLLTIHASKGLQFPIVLVPTLESDPKDPVVFSETSSAGRYVDAGIAVLRQGQRTATVAQRHREELDRLTYVALTRAEQVLIAWKSKNWSGEASAGPFVESLYRYSCSDHVTPYVEIEEVDGSSLDRNALVDMRMRYGLVAPTVKTPRLLEEYGRRWSYSRLSVRRDAALIATSEFDDGAKGEENDQVSNLDPSLPGFKVFGNERGADLGDAVHKTLEHLVGRVSADDLSVLESVASRWFTTYSVTMPGDIAQIMNRILNANLGSAFGGVSLDAYATAGVPLAAEMRFTLGLDAGVEARGDAIGAIRDVMRREDSDGPFRDYFESLVVQPGSRRLTQGYLNGSIDLVVPVVGTETFRVIDYKTNSLRVGPNYDEACLRLEMAQAGYPLQALLYVVALHRHLKWRSRGAVDCHNIAGVSYLYVRGMAESTSPGYGVFNWAIPPRAIEAISSILAGEGGEHA